MPSLLVSKQPVQHVFNLVVLQYSLQRLWILQECIQFSCRFGVHIAGNVVKRAGFQLLPQVIWILSQFLPCQLQKLVHFVVREIEVIQISTPPIPFNIFL